MHATATIALGAEHVRLLQPYVAGKSTSTVARELGLEERDIVKLASNENPLGMPRSARDAIARLAVDGSAMYPDPDGFALKHALSLHLGVATENLTLGGGSDELIRFAARAFLSQGQTAVISQYAFASYALAIAEIDAQAIVVAADNYGHDLAAMLDAIEYDTRLLYLANPNNPTGTFHAPEIIRHFLESVPEHVVVVLDEAYTEYLEDQRRTDVAALIARFPNLIILRTFSKAYGLAALRMGVAIAQAPLSDLLNRVRPVFNTTSFAQAAALAALGDAEFVARTRKLNDLARAQVSSGLNALGLEHMGSAGNFLLVRVGDGQKVFHQLLQAGVIVRPVANYGLPDWLRVSLGREDENARFLRALAAAL